MRFVVVAVECRHAVNTRHGGTIAFAQVILELLLGHDVAALLAMERHHSAGATSVVSDRNESQMREARIEVTGVTGRRSGSSERARMQNKGDGRGSLF